MLEREDGEQRDIEIPWRLSGAVIARVFHQRWRGARQQSAIGITKKRRPVLQHIPLEHAAARRLDRVQASPSTQDADVGRGREGDARAGLGVIVQPRQDIRIERTILGGRQVFGLT